MDARITMITVQRARTTIAIALLMALRSAAAAVNVEMPDEMLGAWCGSWAYQFPESSAGHLWRADDVEDCANRGGISVRKDGWDHHRFGIAALVNLSRFNCLRASPAM
jgi:hypothetical protein